MDESEIIPLGNGRGRKAAEVDLAVVRPLSAADVVAIAEAPEGTALPAPAPLKEIKFQHHRIAVLVARGAPLVEISAETGFSASYISSLKSSPDFAALVEYYGENQQRLLVEAQERLATLGIVALEELQGRLNDTPEKFAVGQLQELVEMAVLKPMTAKTGAAAQVAAAKASAQRAPLTIQFVAPPSAAPYVPKGDQTGQLIEGKVSEID